jgi:hypothetical protein
MKKNIASFLMFVFASLQYTAYAELVFSENVLKHREEIEKALAPCANLISEAAQNKSSKKYVKACECALKQDVSFLDEQTEKDFKNTVYSVYISNALDSHKITKQKKYLNKAFKASKKTVKNENRNINTLKTSMAVATFKGSPKDTSKAYTQMCEVNRNECESYYSEYDEMYNQSITKQKENRKWIKTTALVLLIGLAAFGGAYAGANAANNKKKSMTCRTIGNTTYCDEY